jgi:hypothetical protein
MQQPATVDVSEYGVAFGQGVPGHQPELGRVW